mmetsp:Transcript_26945/g.86626  ORF Transcript_26945/g.86626 Transcript_26945/m.86626 type:complete len:775 (+) Transcript_26945:1279-3603(+)
MTLHRLTSQSIARRADDHGIVAVVCTVFLHDALRHGDALLGQLCEHRVVNVLVYRDDDAAALDGAVHDEGGADGGRQAHRGGHGAVAEGHAVGEQRGQPRLPLAVRHAHAQAVVHEHHVALAGAVLQPALQQLAEGVQRRQRGVVGLVGEQAEEGEAVEHAAGGLGRGLGEQEAAVEQVAHALARVGQLARQHLAPRGRRRSLQRLLAEQAQRLGRVHDLREAAVAQRAPVHGVRLGDVVGGAVRHRVAVGQVLQRERGQDGDGPRAAEQLLAGHAQLGAQGAVARGVAAGQQHAARGPAELVAQRVVGGLGRREAAAEGLERLHGAAVRARLLDHLHGAHVVDARVQAQLAQEGQPQPARLRVQRAHVRAHVRRRHQVLVLLQARLRHARVEGGRHQRDDHVVLRHRARQPRLVAAHVQVLGRDARALGRAQLGLLHVRAAQRHLHVRDAAQVVQQRPRHQARPQHQRLARTHVPHARRQPARQLLLGRAARAARAAARAAASRVHRLLLRALHRAVRQLPQRGARHVRHVVAQRSHLLGHVLHHVRRALQLHHRRARLLAVAAHPHVHQAEVALARLHHVQHAVDERVVEQVPAQQQQPLVRAPRRQLGPGRAHRQTLAVAAQARDVLEVGRQRAVCRHARAVQLGGEVLVLPVERQRAVRAGQRRHERQQRIAKELGRIARQLRRQVLDAHDQRALVVHVVVHQVRLRVVQVVRRVDGRALAEPLHAALDVARDVTQRHHAPVAAVHQLLRLPLGEQPRELVVPVHAVQQH